MLRERKMDNNSILKEIDEAIAMLDDVTVAGHHNRKLMTIAIDKLIMIAKELNEKSEEHSVKAEVENVEDVEETVTT